MLFPKVKKIINFLFLSFFFSLFFSCSSGTGERLSALKDWKKSQNSVGDNFSQLEGKINNFNNKDNSIQGSYLKFESDKIFSITSCDGSGTKTWNGTLYYTTDSESLWYQWSGESIFSAKNDGEKYQLFIRGLGNKIITSCYNWVIDGENISCSGDIRTLLNYQDVDNTTMDDYCFSYMFLNCEALVSAPSLPSLELSDSCYTHMFANCKSLKKAPELPATNLALYCYYMMFKGCESLTQAPSSLPATVLTDCCYYSMFEGCSSLKSAPLLPAKNLVNGCYRNMFSGCTSLEELFFPDIDGSYSNYNNCLAGMFENCYFNYKCNPFNENNLSKFPEKYRDLDSVYFCVVPQKFLFDDKTTLFGDVLGETIDENGNDIHYLLLSNKVKDYTVDISGAVSNFLKFESSNDFSIIANSGRGTKSWDGELYYSGDLIEWRRWGGEKINSSKAPKGDASNLLYIRGIGNTIISNGEPWRLNGNDISCSGDIRTLLDCNDVDNTTMGNSCFACMFFGCDSLISAPSLPSLELSDKCYLQMFGNCSSLTEAPELPATTLRDSCYRGMFGNCIALAQAPALAATTLADYCYTSMFMNCDSLTQAPELPATDLKKGCYGYMFSNCSSLKSAPKLIATTLRDYCYWYMFLGCESLTEAPELPATILADNCYYGMFASCTSLIQPPELPATDLKKGCYSLMFAGCISLKEAVEFNVTSNTGGCCYSMFRDCINIQAIILPKGNINGKELDDNFEEMYEGCYYNYGCNPFSISDKSSIRSEYRSLDSVYLCLLPQKYVYDTNKAPMTILGSVLGSATNESGEACYKLYLSKEVKNYSKRASN